MAFSHQRNHLLLSPSLFSRIQTILFHFQSFKHELAVEEKSRHHQRVAPDFLKKKGSLDTSTRKVVDSRLVGIKWSMIIPSTWLVLKLLRRKGFETYLVGGCVRDLLLKKTPKDFDVVTTADLIQIKKLFYNCRIVGRNFPICRVKIYDDIIEVSSFNTIAKHSRGKEEVDFSQMPTGCDKKDFVRWKDSLRRDFTINSLLFDPLANTIYDYTGGIEDLKKCKVRTISPACESFKEDCVRILRALRIAARLDLQLSKETASAIRELSSSIVMLDKSRLMLELNYMLAYGAAESSLCLLRRFRLLEIILPIHGAYLVEQAENHVTQSSTMLMKLFSSLDKLLASDCPSDCSLWVGILAFHLALVDHPQDALVVWTFASILYYGNWCQAVEFARENVQMGIGFLPEILKTSIIQSDESLSEEVSHLASIVMSSIDALTTQDILLKKAGRYPHFQHHGLTFISKKMGQAVSELFGVLETDIKSFVLERTSYDIDYKLLGNGAPNEIRFVLGKVIMDTMRSGVVQSQNQEFVKVVKNTPQSQNQKFVKVVKNTPQSQNQEFVKVVKNTPQSQNQEFVKVVKNTRQSQNQESVKVVKNTRPLSQLFL